MKAKYILFLIFPLFISCGKDYQPNDYFPDADDGVGAFFPDSIGKWEADINLDWINDSSKSITAIYGDSDILYNVILLENASSKKIIKDKILPNFKGFRLKRNKSGFKYIGKNKNETILIWQNAVYLYKVRFKNQYETMAVDSCYFLEYK